MSCHPGQHLLRLSSFLMKLTWTKIQCLKSGINAYAFLCTRFVIINTLIYEIIPFKCNIWIVHYKCTFYIYIVKVHFLITFHEQTKNFSMASLTMNRLVVISRYWHPSTLVLPYPRMLWLPWHIQEGGCSDYMNSTISMLDL